MNFNEFIAKHTNEALFVELKKENILIYNILEETKNKANNSQLPNSKKEVREFCEKHLPIIEKRIFQAFINRRTPEMYKGHTAPFLIDLKVYYSYLEILTKILGEDFTPTITETTTKYNEFKPHHYFPKPLPSEAKPKKSTGKQYAVTYVLDCKAQNKTPASGKALEGIGKELTKGELAGNTFYKNYLEIAHKDFTQENVLIKHLGENWRSIVLRLSTDKKSLDKYIKEQF